MKEIKRVAVLGSGVMGGAIAAHLANCGIPSLMLDIVPPNLSDKEKGDRVKRNGFGEASKQAMLKMKPSPLYRKTNLDMIEVGNFEDDFPRIAECDWICEVVKEDLSIKKKVFEQVSKHRRPGSIVSTNTSGVLIGSMVDVMDADMRKHFLGTHFFNPPRYLKLLEVIPGKDTLPEVVAAMSAFGENVLGKGIVLAKDCPNFVANRLLTYACQFIIDEFPKLGLSAEDVDALTGPNIGHANSATFRTLDLVGLDTYLHVIKNVYDGCLKDECRGMFAPPELLTKMVEKGLLGEKSGSGFFKKTEERDEKGKRVILSLDPKTLEYVPPKKSRFDCIGAARNAGTLAAKVKAMHTGDDNGSQFVWKYFSALAVYAGNRIPEIADDIVNIDNAVKWGFAWEIGIFETWDALGFQYVCDRMKKDGLKLPPIAEAMQEAGVDSFYGTLNGKACFFDLGSKSYKEIPQNPNECTLTSLKESKGVVKENEFCSLIDLGDGILCCEFHTKMNVIDGFLLEIVKSGVDLVNEGKFEGMVLGNQAPHFCAGANLMLILGEIMQEHWDAVERAVDVFQKTNMAMRFCRGPVVSAPHHYAFGGAIEMTQHAARAVVAGETYGGLVEAGVGVIPAGGGTKEMLRRALAYVPATVPEGDPFPYVRRAFETIAMAKVSTSGAELIELGYITENDVVCPNWDHQIKRAKDVCRGMLMAGYTPPQPATLIALGAPGRAVFKAGIYQLRLGGFASEHDAVIAGHTANILTGGDRLPGTKMSEQDVLDLEKEAFCSLCGTEKTQARIQNMLATGKPLRN